MKIARVRIEHFKALRSLDLPLVDSDGVPRPVTLVLGDNSSGKTTLLQALALTLSLATRDTDEPARFEWPGFLAERVGSLGTPRVTLDVEFEADELTATKLLYDRWSHRVPPERRSGLVAPEAHRAVTLVYEGGAGWVNHRGRRIEDVARTEVPGQAVGEAPDRGVLLAGSRLRP